MQQQTEFNVDKNYIIELKSFVIQDLKISCKCSVGLRIFYMWSWFATQGVTQVCVHTYNQIKNWKGSFLATSHVTRVTHLGVKNTMFLGGFF